MEVEPPPVKLPGVDIFLNPASKVLMLMLMVMLMVMVMVRMMVDGDDDDGLGWSP